MPVALRWHQLGPWQQLEMLLEVGIEGRWWHSMPTNCKCYHCLCLSLYLRGDGGNALPRQGKAQRSNGCSRLRGWLGRLVCALQDSEPSAQ
jgi:hypothetical protein